MTAPIGPTDGRRVRTPGLDLVVPGAWWRIPLRGTAVRERSVKALVERQLSGAAASLSLRHEIEQALLTSAADAARQRGVMWWISLDTALGVPLSMSLLLTEIDPFRVRGLDQVVEQLGDREGVAGSRMRPGRVVRQAYRRDPGEAAQRLGAVARPGSVPVVTETLQVDYWLERPDEQVVQLAFSSPLVRYESALLELFDTVVDSVTWQDPDAPVRRQDRP